MNAAHIIKNTEPFFRTRSREIFTKTEAINVIKNDLPRAVWNKKLLITNLSKLSVIGTSKIEVRVKNK